MVMEGKLDIEWLYLMVEAKETGITVEEIRTFLQNRSIIESSHLTNKSEGSCLPKTR
ncbi:hypothetical protein CFK37_06520 [Virgibacillus phasianinus]|uniref:Sin domain-containing protein n=1 Tax=Virgibacillus phasianinus TaxID=2017483 RepID=A0A220U1M8_9BACI|nr:anti-repressor SinI family protein [Virgibacillus phasianinus]ASK61836.1 hypothetical protein CFK37_06520 [Virgibacillus phasianinus]